MITHLSYSSIQLYLTCPENWRRKYVEKQPQPSSPALVFGSAMHTAIESVVTGEMPTLPEAWKTAWTAQVESESNVDWGGDTPEHHFNEGLRILGSDDVQAMIGDVKPLVDENGAFVERKVTLEVPGVPVPIIGYIDIVGADGVPGDFKTSKNRWSQDKAQSELQPLFYLAALSQAGVDIPDLAFRHYIITKAKTPVAQVLEHTHTWSEIFWLFESIQRVWKGIEAEVYPMNPNGWLCGPKYCAYWSECRGRK